MFAAAHAKLILPWQYLRPHASSSITALNIGSVCLSGVLMPRGRRVLVEEWSVLPVTGFLLTHQGAGQIYDLSVTAHGPCVGRGGGVA